MRQRRFLFHLLGSIAFLLHTAAMAAEAIPIPVPKPTKRFGLGDIRCLKVSSDLKYLASGGQGGAFLWSVDPPDGALPLNVPGAATAVDFAPDASTVFVASGIEILAFNTTNTQQQLAFSGHTREINRLRVSRDGHTLASASADNTVRLWDATTGDQRLVVQIPGSPVMDVDFSTDGRRFATVDTFLTNSVRIWDRSSGELLRSLPTTNTTLQRCLYSPNGNLLTLGADRILTLWDESSGTPLRTYTGINETSVFIQDFWFPNDTTLAAVLNDGRVLLWNLETAQLIKTLTGEPVIAATGVPGDSMVLMANLDLDIHIRQLPGGDSLRVWRGHTTSTHSCVSFSPDGQFVLSGGVEPSLRLWNRESGALVRTFAVSPAGTASAGFSADGRHVFGTIGLPNPGVRLWDASSGEVIRNFTWSSSWPTTASISIDGSKVAAGAQDRRVRIYNATNGALVHNFTMPELGWASRLAFAPTKPWLAIGSTDSSITFLDLNTGQVTATIPEAAGSVTALQFSPDTRILLVAWQDGLVRLYETEQFEILQEFFPQSGFLDAAALSPDGSLLITGESFPNFIATVWDTTTGRILRTLSEHRWAVSAVGFDATGASVLTGADRVREWSVADMGARVSIVRTATSLEVNWNRGLLEQAPTPDGPWELLTQGSSPWRIPKPSGEGRPHEFFRVRAAF